jgi:hypothetical protein
VAFRRPGPGWTCPRRSVCRRASSWPSKPTTSKSPVEFFPRQKGTSKSNSASRCPKKKCRTRGEGPARGGKAAKRKRRPAVSGGTAGCPIRRAAGRNGTPTHQLALDSDHRHVAMQYTLLHACYAFAGDLGRTEVRGRHFDSSLRGEGICLLRTLVMSRTFTAMPAVLGRGGPPALPLHRPAEPGQNVCAIKASMTTYAGC